MLQSIKQPYAVKILEKDDKKTVGIFMLASLQHG